jgi:RNA polymerase sigma-70 factor (ECF subfamily)
MHKFGDLNSAGTKAYIIRIIKSSAINIYRKNKKKSEREVSIDDDVLQYRDPHQDVEHCVIERHGASQVSEMIDGLGESDRSIVLLRCRDGMSWKEVSEKLSITEENARKRFQRIRKKLISMKGEISDEK